MEPANPSTLNDWAIYIFGGIGILIAEFMRRSGRNVTPEPHTKDLTLSGALMDNRVVDPLVDVIVTLTEVTRRNNELLAQLVALETAQAAEEKRRADLDDVAETVVQRMERLMREAGIADFPKIRGRE